MTQDAKTTNTADDIDRKCEELEKCLKKTLKTRDNFRQIVEYMPVPVFVSDYKSDIIVYVNSAFCAMTGYDEKDLLDKPVTMLMTPTAQTEREVMRQHVTEEMLDELMGKARSHTMDFIKKSGESVTNRPAMFYNWRSNGDRFVTMIYMEVEPSMQRNRRKDDAKIPH